MGGEWSLFKMNSRHSLFLLSFILAFCSFSYEIILAFVVAKITGHEILSQTISIGSFIVGLGLGSYWNEKNPQDDKIGFLQNVEIVLSLVGGLGVFFIFGWDILVRSLSNTPSFFLFFIPVQLYILLIGFLSGLELPCLLDENKSQNRILGFHYLGTLISSLLIFAWFIPKIDVFLSTILIALLNVSVALLLFLKSTRKKTQLIGVSIVSMVLIVLMVVSPKFYSQYLKIYYFQPEISKFADISHASKILDSRPEIRRYRSQYQYIDFIDEVQNGKTSLVMFLDHRKQFSSTHEHIYHEQMVHVPLDLHKHPIKNVLVLGGGDGLIARELLKYDEVERITLVELDQDVLNFATTDVRFTKLNQNSLKSPKVKIVVADAISYIRNSQETFDAVFLDFPFPNNYDLAKLYSLEFYKAVGKRMAEESFMILDYPIDKNAVASSHRNEVILSTLQYAGFPKPKIYGKEDSFVMVSVTADKIYGEGQSQYLSERSRKELIFYDDIVWNTEISEDKVNSIFKPQTLRARRGGW